jgi:hypothetical protein
MLKSLISTAVVISTAFLISNKAIADDLGIDDRLKQLEAAYTEILIRDREKDQLIANLQRELGDLQKGKRRLVDREDLAPKGSDHDGHGQHEEDKKASASNHTSHDDHNNHSNNTPSDRPDLFALDTAGGTARLSGIFVDTAFAAGGSSEAGATLQQLQFGGHDPDENGFTVRTVDISFSGGFDPYFDSFANLALFIDNEGETKIELEEAFLQTKGQQGALPQLRAGQFFTEFGLLNPTHIHDQTWLDQPFAVSRFFGPDGLRGQGLRLKWGNASTSPFSFLLGAQNAFGETQASFRSSDEQFAQLPIGGLTYVEQDIDGLEEIAFHGRAARSFSGPNWLLGLGASGAAGPNASGEDGTTIIGGLDVTFTRELPGERRLTLQGEYLYRDYEVDRLNPAGGNDLEDQALYLQGTIDLAAGLSFGMRGEYGTGDGESVGTYANRKADPYRSDRIRISPLVAWSFAPAGRLTLQYNYDNVEFLPEGEAHAVWLGLNFSFGAGQRGELTEIAGHNHH